MEDYEEYITGDEETDDHQSYRYLYEKLREKHDMLTKEYDGLIADYHIKERETAELIQNNELLKSKNELLNKSIKEMTETLKKYMEQGIMVSEVIPTPKIAGDAIDTEWFAGSISSHPGVYGGKRPSWYTPITNELSRSNIKRKNVENTSGILKDKLLFWKMAKGKDKETIKDEYDARRKDNILKLLHSNCSNQEKYLKYFLLTPGLDSEYVKTLQGASDMNLNANLIIALLEQPNDMYNRDIVELYVSEVHKGTEYDIKQELANELVRGEWSIKAVINGEAKRMQLVPIEEFEDLKFRIDSICGSETDEKVSENECELYSEVEFDESILDQY
jgi:hypothetical protein